MESYIKDSNSRDIMRDSTSDNILWRPQDTAVEQGILTLQASDVWVGDLKVDAFLIWVLLCFATTWRSVAN